MAQPNKKKSVEKAEAPESNLSNEDSLGAAGIEEQLAQLRSTTPIAYAAEESKSPLASPIGYKRKHGGLPATKKSLGQNWLEDPEATQAIVEALGCGKGDLVFEVGPGGGALTEPLIKSGADIVAFELDQRMINVLEHRFAGVENFKVLHQDALQVDLAEVAGERSFFLAGNLPYHITSSLLFGMFEFALANPGKIRKLVILVQYEVAVRIAAEPGSSSFSILSIFTRLWGTPHFIRKVPRTSFKPSPKVDAGIIELEFSENPLYPLPSWVTFRRLVKGTFKMRRKMLRNSMKSIAHIGDWEKLDFDWTRRPQTVSTEEYAWLASKLIPKNMQEEDS